MASPTAVGVQIFTKNEPTAVDNFCIYLNISETLSDTITHLKMQHNKQKDCAIKHGVVTYEIKLCIVYENEKKRMVTMVSLFVPV